MWFTTIKIHVFFGFTFCLDCPGQLVSFIFNPHQFFKNEPWIMMLGLDQFLNKRHLVLLLIRWLIATSWSNRSKEPLLINSVTMQKNSGSLQMPKIWMMQLNLALWSTSASFSRQFLSLKHSRGCRVSFQSQTQ